MTPSRNFEENALKIQKKPRKSLQIHKTLLPLQSPNKKARSRDRAGYLREQIRKGEKVATSPTKGDGRGNLIEIWCNGSTTDSGSVSEGSSPSISTKADESLRPGLVPQISDGGIAQLVRAHDS